MKRLGALLVVTVSVMAAACGAAPHTTPAQNQRWTADLRTVAADVVAVHRDYGVPIMSTQVPVVPGECRALKTDGFRLLDDTVPSFLTASERQAKDDLVNVVLAADGCVNIGFFEPPSQSQYDSHVFATAAALFGRFAK